MDGEGIVTCIEREHLRSPSCGSHQYQFLPQACQGPHNGTCQRGLTRTSRATQDHHGMGIPVHHEATEHIQCVRLLFRRLVAEVLQYPIFQFVTYHFGYKVNKNAEAAANSSLFTLHFSLFFLVFCSLIRTFAAEMKITNNQVNIVLAILAVGLFAACIASVMSAMK